MLFCWALSLMMPIRRHIEHRIWRVFRIVTFFNLCIFGFTLHYLRFMSINQLFFTVVKVIEIVINSAQKALMGIAALFVLIMFWKFKDRILETLGVDNPTMVIGEFRDWATCWSMKRFYPIEVFIWKVEGLPSMNIQSNDVFAEVSCGYNNVMRTRVHMRAGHSCVFKESLQLNFDHFDTETRLYINIKNQDVMGSTDIASIQMGASQVKRFLELEPRELDTSTRTLGWGAGTKDSVRSEWKPDNYTPIDLIPAGQIYVRFRRVEDEDKHKGPRYGTRHETC